MKGFKTIKLNQHFGNQISTRVGVVDFFKETNKYSNVILDASSITFISRAAAHELISLINSNLISNKEISLINTTTEVERMFDIVKKSIASPEKKSRFSERKTFKNEQEYQNYFLSF
ncbi:MAG: hypothetical protein EAZ53_10575 [Bacteroidetes bacterium]|nr:MAG: hypothetical protein EAZ53_10575 [Bacteroidota bacterium]